MQVNLFFNWLSNGELLTLKIGPPCKNLFFEALFVGERKAPTLESPCIVSKVTTILLSLLSKTQLFS